MNSRRKSIWNAKLTAIQLVLLVFGWVMVYNMGQWSIPVISVLGAIVLGALAFKALTIVTTTALIVTSVAGIRDAGWSSALVIVSMVFYGAILLRMKLSHPRWQ